jgi:hypothetical protein
MEWAMPYNTIQYNKFYLKSENIKHYNTSSNELLNPPFKLANSPQMFERLVERVLADFSWKIFLVYLANINVFSIISKTSDEHLMNLENHYGKQA